MRFSSGKRKSVIADPTPFVANSFDLGEIRTAAGYAGYRNTFDPRAEFEVPLTNPANGVLEELRKAEEIVGSSGWPRAAFLDALTYAVFAPELVRAHVRSASPAERDHARRVLLRLSTLEKDS